MDTTHVVATLVLAEGVEVLTASLAVLGPRGVHRRVPTPDDRESGEVLNRGVYHQPVDRAVGCRQLGQPQRI